MKTPVSWAVRGREAMTEPGMAYRELAAAVSEGLCPLDHARLTPFRDGGLCPTCNSHWAWDGSEVRMTWSVDPADTLRDV